METKYVEVLSTDAARVKVLLTALKRGKWELEGEEILAFGQMFAWASQFIGRLEEAKTLETLLPQPEAAEPETYEPEPERKYDPLETTRRENPWVKATQTRPA